MPHAGQDPHLIPLDLHAPAAAVASLSTLQFVIDEVEIDRNVGREPFHKRNQCLPVRLTGGPIAQHGASIHGFP